MAARQVAWQPGTLVRFTTCTSLNESIKREELMNHIRYIREEEPDMCSDIENLKHDVETTNVVDFAIYKMMGKLEID